MWASQFVLEENKESFAQVESPPSSYFFFCLPAASILCHPLNSPLPSTLSCPCLQHPELHYKRLPRTGPRCHPAPVLQAWSSLNSPCRPALADARLCGSWPELVWDSVGRITSPGTELSGSIIGSLILIPALTVLQANYLDRKGYIICFGKQQKLATCYNWILRNLRWNLIGIRLQKLSRKQIMQMGQPKSVQWAHHLRKVSWGLLDGREKPFKG